MIKPQRISSSPRLYLCPGSAMACEALDLKPVEPQTPQKTAATSGRTIHDAVHTILAGGNLDDWDLTVREEGVSEWFAECVKREELKPGRAPTMILPEQEVYIAEMWVGHWDRLVVYGDWGTILWEWKTGRLHQEPASGHVQGRLYAVAAMETIRCPLPLIFYVISAGEEKGEHLSMCVFDKEPIEMAKKEAEIIWERANTIGANRIPGQIQCKYCPARGTPVCPETFQMIEIAHASLIAEISKTPEKLGDAMLMWKDVQPYGKNLENVVRMVLENGMKIPGIAFGTPKAPRIIEDVAAGYLKLKDIMTQETYLKCCDVSVPEIEKYLYKNQAVVPGQKRTTRKATANLLEAQLGDTMKRIPERPPIVRSDQEEEGEPET